MESPPAPAKWPPVAAPSDSAEAALSPVWGPLDEQAQQAAQAILRDLCLFDEHTWGASDSIGQPHSLDTWAQYNEKSRTAYRPMALAKLLLSQRSRTAIYPREEGLYVANTARSPWTGWVVMPASCLRGDFHSLAKPRDARTDAARVRSRLSATRAAGRT